MSLTPIRKPSIDFHAPRGALTHGNMGNPFGVVLHDTESHEVVGIGDIKGIVSFWERTPDKLGAHFIVDQEGNIAQCGEPDELMFHCGGANTGRVGIEQINFASSTKHQWESHPDQLIKVAKLLAWLHTEYGIPLRVSTVTGISTHAMQSKIHPESQGHTDPGAGYPLDEVIAIAKGFVTAGGWPKDGGTTVTRPKKRHRVYHITYTTRKGERKTIVNHSPGLWVSAHPRAKHRGDIVIHPVHRR
jgi:hypothetical protein